MNDVIHSLFAVVAGITGVAIIAVILSRNSNTAGVIQAASAGYTGALGVALSPVMGNVNGMGSNSFGAGAQY